MPVDDGGVTGSGGINGEVIDVVDVEDANLANFQCSGVREPLSPNPSVDIAPNCHIRSNLRQFVQDLWLAYITCMDDQFRTLKSFDGFGTQQPVCIRNDANDVGLVHALGFLAPNASGLLAIVSIASGRICGTWRLRPCTD